MQTQMIINGWNSTVKRTSALFESLSDDQMMKEVPPNWNRGIYLLGHLTAVHDLMLPLLRFRESLFPELKVSFIGTPENPDEQSFSVADLRHKWLSVNEELKEHFDNLTTEEWLQKHHAITEEDFAKEPHRNRLNVVLSRSNHLSYHLGQLTLLKK